VPALVGVGVQRPQAADQHRHFGRCEGEQLRLVDQHFLRGGGVERFQIVAETIGLGFEHRERSHVRLLLRSIAAAGREWHRDAVTGVFGRLFDTGTAT